MTRETCMQRPRQYALIMRAVCPCLEGTDWVNQNTQTSKPTEVRGTVMVIFYRCTSRTAIVQGCIDILFYR